MRGRSTAATSEATRRARRLRGSRTLSLALLVVGLAAVPVSGAPVPSLSQPSGLVVRSASTTSVRVSWAASNADARVVGYRVYVDDELLGSVRSPTYLIRRLECGTSYKVSVSAFDDAGHGSSLRSRTARTPVCGSSPSSSVTALTAPAACTRTVDPGVSLPSALRAAAPGSVMCLSGGDYGPVTLQNVNRPGTVVVQPADGADVTIGALTVQSSSYLRFTGRGGTMRLGGLDLDGLDGSSSWSHDLTFDHVTWTAPATVRARTTGQAIVFDSDILDNLQAELYEGRITVRGYDNTAPVGVTISHSHFGGGCSDGVQVVGNAYGVRIGPGNEFTGIQQLGCDPVHADPIQLYGAVGTVVTGNWFHDNGNGTGGLASFAGDSPATVTDNVFVCTCIYPHSIGAWGARSWLVAHNTFVGGGALRFQTTDDGKAPGGNVVRDNVWVGGGGISTDTSDWGTSDHNLNSGVPGVGNVRGKPKFVGGAHPTTYAGYRLASGSPGTGAASDGKDMGIRGSG